MPRLVIEEQRKKLENNVINLSDIFTVDQMKQFAEDRLYSSQFLPDLAQSMPESSRVLIFQTKISQEQDMQGRYLVTLEGRIMSHEKIFRSPAAGQAVYFSQNFLGNVKDEDNIKPFPYPKNHHSQSYRDRAFERNNLKVEFELPFTTDLFMRHLKIFTNLEAVIDNRGVVFGSGSDFEDLAKVTLEEERRRELTRVCVNRNWLPYSPLNKF